ncbi:MAG TPA: four helix bundle protein [Candidatus Woesebacteria bacterium]|nr:four helix bundle protein [Candidatus Woesebacteria bacterium]HPR99345.1 four helix bundle protein [Candidatus Woesebacteria bacterium]
MIREFTDLLAWQNSHTLVLKIYKLTDKFPQKELYGLGDQIRRAVVSITSNIAEGFGRHTYKEKIQFYYQAHGSLTEVKNQLIIAKDVNYISQEDFEDTLTLLTSAHKLLLGLISKTKLYLSESPRI